MQAEKFLVNCLIVIIRNIEEESNFLKQLLHCWLLFSVLLTTEKERNDLLVTLAYKKKN